MKNWSEKGTILNKTGTIWHLVTLKHASFCSQGQPMPTPKGQSIMCAYKLCKVEFRYWGMQSKIERFIHDMALRNTMLGAHRQVGIEIAQLFTSFIDNSFVQIFFFVTGLGLAG